MILNATPEYRVRILVSLLNRDNFSSEYLKQINFITGGPLGAEGPGQLPPFPPLNPALGVWQKLVCDLHFREPLSCTHATIKTANLHQHSAHM